MISSRIIDSLAPLSRTPPGSAGYGECQRVIIARGLTTQAAVLLLDKPTANLDIVHALDVLDLCQVVDAWPEVSRTITDVRHVKGVNVPTSLVLTVLGEDRPGLVESLAYIIAAHEGNWLESRMAHLAGQFAGILRASVSDAAAAGLINALQGLASHGLQGVIAQSSPDEPARDSRWLMLDLVGSDHLGIIRDLAHALAQRGINIDELQTERTSAPMTGGMLFKATARLRVPLEVTVAELQVALDQLAHDLMVDIALEGPVRT